MSGIHRNSLRPLQWISPLVRVPSPLAVAHPAAAETVEVAPGVQVTKRTYSAPANEQPFYGFIVKDAAQRAADERFVTAVIQATGSREKAFDETTNRGWRAIAAGNAP